MRGAPLPRAVAGCLLVAGGIGGLAFIPQASPFWTIAPQLLAGCGIGMALPAIAGELLPERTRGEAAALLSVRHAGITLALVALAPLVAAKLDDQVQLARERGTAVVLDAPLPPTDKIELAPRLFADIETDDPRDALRQAVKRASATRHRDRRPRPGQPAAAARSTSSGSTASCWTASAAWPAASTQLLGAATTARAQADRRSRASTSSATTSTTWCWPPSHSAFSPAFC